MLVAARVVQGLVAAPLVPLAMSMLLGRGSGRRPVASPRWPASCCSSARRSARPSAGRSIGAGGWRAIFVINVPFGVLAAVAVRSVPPALAPGRTPGTRFDLPGLVLLAAGLTGLLLGATEGPASGWASPATLVPLTAGVALLAGYVGWAARRDQPALDLSLARHKVPALSMALCALASVVTWAAVFLLPVFVQSVQGRSALAAGLALLPQGVITGLSTALAPRLLTGLTVRVTVLAGFAVLAVASLGLLSGRRRHTAVGDRADPGLPVGLHRAGHQPAAAGPDPAAPARAAGRREHVVQHLAADRRVVRHRPARRPVRDPGPHAGPGRRPAPGGVVLGSLAAAGALAALALPRLRNTALSRA